MLLKEWEEKAKQAKAEYEVAMAEYRENLKSESEGKAKATAKSPTKSPKKVQRKSDHGGTGGEFKSKEFISSEESSSSDENKPLKKKAKKKVRLNV